jgi:hypothetical protein
MTYLCCNSLEVNTFQKHKAPNLLPKMSAFGIVQLPEIQNTTSPLRQPGYPVLGPVVLRRQIALVLPLSEIWLCIVLNL